MPKICLYRGQKAQIDRTQYFKADSLLLSFMIWLLIISCNYVSCFLVYSHLYCLIFCRFTLWTFPYRHSRIGDGDQCIKDIIIHNIRANAISIPDIKPKIGSAMDRFWCSLETSVNIWGGPSPLRYELMEDAISYSSKSPSQM